MAVPKPSVGESISQSLQVWQLQGHAWWNPISGLVFFLMRPFIFREAVQANSGAYLYHKRAVFGDNFCCAGGVWLGEFKEVERALTQPQAREFRLAPTPLDTEHLPSTSEGGRLTFLLALSQKEVGGDGSWEAFRGAVNDMLTQNKETIRRQKDGTAQALRKKLVAEYKDMGHTKEFFENPDRGLRAFLLRYLHYVIMGLDPNDKEKMETLTNLHYDSKSAAYHLKVAGNLFQSLKFKKWPEMFQKAAKIYEESPAISMLPEGDPKYMNMTKHELGLLMVSLMALAGMIGPITLAVIALGHRELNDYEGKETGNIDVVKIWDKLNIEDRDEVKRYLFECGRLRNPVSNSHRVSTEPFTVKIRGKERTFPKGTTIFIPMLFGGLDEGFWGPTTFDFDHNRENLCPYAMMFHSVGDRSAGRICPGRDIAVEMLVNVLIDLGEVRREKMQKMGTKSYGTL